MDHVNKNKRQYINDDKKSVKIWGYAERLDDYRDLRHGQSNLDEPDMEYENQLRDSPVFDPHIQRNKRALSRLV